LKFADNCILIDRINFGGFPNELKGNPKKIIDRIRYYVEINPGSYAMIDYCNNNDIEPIVSVDFNCMEEAQGFEVPSWFGNEILSPIEIKTKKKEKKNNIYN
jgi:CYTH domain-containing protein